MKRREAFKNISLFIYGSLAIPAGSFLHSCSPSTKKVEWIPKFLNDEEAFFLNEITNTIIPNTEYPGALEAGVPSEIEDYIFNVFGDEDIIQFREELAQLENFLSSNSKSFFNLTLLEKTNLLNNLQLSENNNERKIYMKIKSLVVTSYFRSEIGATKVLKYNGPSIVLGEYKGCIPLSEVGKTWAI